MEASTVAAAAIGYQGFGNLGDEAILAGIEVLLAPTPVRVRTLIVGDRAAVPAFPEARRFAAGHLIPQPRTLGALRGTDVLVFTGGGLLHDHWSLVIPQYLAWSALARLARRRIIWFAVGIGPLRTRRGRVLARLTLRLASAVTVRDDQSRAAARQLGRGDAQLIPDPAVFLAPPAPARRAGLAIVVRGTTPRESEHEATLVGALSQFAAQRAGRGDRVTVMTFGGPSDRRVAAAVSGGDVEELLPDPAVALRRLATFDAVVTVRLHGLILASVADTPWVAIAYDEKVQRVAASLGADRRQVVALEAISADALEAALEIAVSDVARAATRKGLQRLRAQAATIGGLVTAAARAAR